MTASVLTRRLSTGVVLALLGLAVLWFTRDFPWGVPAAADPALLPRVVGIGLLLVGLGVAATDLVRTRASEPSSVATRTAPGQESDPRHAALLAAAAVVYSLAAFRLGFVTSTVLFVAAVGLLLGHGRDRRSLVVLALVAAVLAYAASIGFFTLLDVRPPSTPLP